MSGSLNLLISGGAKVAFLFNLSTASTVDLRTAAISAGWDGSSKVIATLPSGQTLSASSSGVFALTISGSFPGGVVFNNAGTINGSGGLGGVGGTNAANGTSGSIGGSSIQASVSVALNNSGTITAGSFGPKGSGYRASQRRIGIAAFIARR